MAKTVLPKVKPGDVLILVGTMKGLFILRSDGKRGKWERGGPFFAGREIYSLAWDDRAGRTRLWVAESSMHWGSVLRSSDDFGKTWTPADKANVKFPED